MGAHGTPIPWDVLEELDGLVFLCKFLEIKMKIYLHALGKLQRDPTNEDFEPAVGDHLAHRLSSSSNVCYQSPMKLVKKSTLMSINSC